MRQELVRQRQPRAELEGSAQRLLRTGLVGRDLGDLEVLADDAVRAPETGPGRREARILRHALGGGVTRHGQLRQVAADLVGAQVVLVGTRARGSLSGSLGPGRATERA